MTGKAAHCVGGKIKKVAAPALKGVMIASAAVTVLSCVGWLVAQVGTEKPQTVQDGEVRCASPDML